MTDITHDEIRDMLPDLLHAGLDPDRRQVVEDHLRSCAGCASEMRVLQMVKDAPSFAPMIDAVKVASAIPPYGGVPAERPRARNRIGQMAIAIAAVVLVAVTVMSRGNSSSTAVPAAPAAVASAPVTAPERPSIAMPAATLPASAPKSTAQGKAAELQIATRIDDLSDGSVAALLNEIDGLDGLPSAEPAKLGVGDPATAGEGGA